MAEWYDRYIEFKNSDWKPTKLSPSEEKEFKSWLMKSKWFTDLETELELSGKNISAEELYNDITGPNSDYDYRGAWKSGLGAQDYEYDTRMHWPSSTQEGKMLKAPSHTTAWMEFFMQDTGIDPNSLGLRNAEEAQAYTEKLKDYSAFVGK